MNHPQERAISMRITQPGPVVIDLSVPHAGGGFDPEAPLVLTGMRVAGRVMIGHTASLDDPAAPVLIREADISDYPGGALYVEGRCPSCTARAAIFRDEGETLLVLEHAADCAELAALLRQVPR
jgi:hypothetical protein